MKNTSWNTTSPEELRRQLKDFEDTFYRSQTYDAIRRIFEKASSVLGLNTQRITAVASPTDATDAANKAYVDGLTTGIPLSKLATQAANTLVANATAGVAAPTAVPLGASLAFSGGSLIRAALTGDVTAPANSNATTCVQGKDGTFNVVNTADTTKKLGFNVSAITTATTRTAYFPDADLDLAHYTTSIYEDFNDTFTNVGTSSTNGAFIGRVSFQNVSAGTWTPLAFSNLSAEHPGILRLGLPATIGAISGILTDVNLLRGGDFQFWIFRTPSSFANLRARIGQFAGNIANEPTDGAYLWQTSGTSTFGFKTAKASVRTVGTTTTLSTDTWYALQIVFAANLSSVTMTLLNGDTGATIISQTISATMPDATNTLWAQAIVETTAATAVTNALDLDLFMARHGTVSAPLTRARPIGEWSL